MVPIYESDLAEERWAKNKWDLYELYEKVEARKAKKRRVWIIFTITFFLILSAIPVIVDRRGKWQSYTAVRKLGQELNALRREAALGQKAVRLRFTAPGTLKYVVETAIHCDSQSWAQIRLADLLKEPRSFDYAVITASQSKDLDIPGLINNFCYDPFRGTQTDLDALPVKSGMEKTPNAFAVIPVKDLTEKRLDRVSFLMLARENSETNFE